VQQQQKKPIQMNQQLSVTKLIYYQIGFAHKLAKPRHSLLKCLYHIGILNVYKIIIFRWTRHDLSFEHQYYENPKNTPLLEQFQHSIEKSYKQKPN
jgi:hypothetical protein